MSSVLLIFLTLNQLIINIETSMLFKFKIVNFFFYIGKKSLVRPLDEDEYVNEEHSMFYRPLQEMKF